ncbi:hypothetical protein LNTAR_12281 [Lentisphaera araneosa HTCC2155]|uniref:Uncharacterized protein n=1 Tax=Lentisphaera araneosa HTCC2155 TaxID=313628 RepID=A6DJQ7_9BACT|nr:hypothetical protein LNTAR_12281 [Lentisphaera araneosa HTCC2155]
MGFLLKACFFGTHTWYVLHAFPGRRELKSSKLLFSTRLPIKRGKVPNRLVKERHFLAGGARGGQRLPRMGASCPLLWVIVFFSV